MENEWKGRKFEYFVLDNIPNSCMIDGVLTRSLNYYGQCGWIIVDRDITIQSLQERL